LDLGFEPTFCLIIFLLSHPCQLLLLPFSASLVTLGFALVGLCGGSVSVTGYAATAVVLAGSLAIVPLSFLDAPQVSQHPAQHQCLR
jgi:hypothetical protein